MYDLFPDASLIHIPVYKLQRVKLAYKYTVFAGGAFFRVFQYGMQAFFILCRLQRFAAARFYAAPASCAAIGYDMDYLVFCAFISEIAEKDNEQGHACQYNTGCHFISE
jgi:hypothetical protein